MSDLIKSELDDIVKTIADTGIATKIILFGSHATGNANIDSDIDLCVLTHIKDKHPADIAADLGMSLVNVQKRPLDLLAYNQDMFAVHSARSTSFEHIIDREGVVLYER